MFPEPTRLSLNVEVADGITGEFPVSASAASCAIDQEIHHVLKNNKQRAVIPPHALLITYLKFLQQPIKPPHSGFSHPRPGSLVSLNTDSN